MKIIKEFEVAHPPATVWEFLQDVPAVAQCLPGAELTEEKGDGLFAGLIGVKLGPISSTFEGECTVTQDHATLTGIISGKGVDRRGGSRGQISVDYRLKPAEAGTKVSLDADATLSGAAAQFGRSGLIEDMANRLISEFVECLEKKLAAETAEEAAAVSTGEIKGISVYLVSLWAWIKRLFRGGS